MRREKSKDHYNNIIQPVGCMIIPDTMNLRLLADARSDERWSSVVVEVRDHKIRQLKLHYRFLVPTRCDQL
jgi:hypothetical protein